MQFSINILKNGLHVLGNNISKFEFLFIDAFTILIFFQFSEYHAICIFNIPRPCVHLNKKNEKYF